MSKIVWDKTGERYLESGVSHGVLYSRGGEKKNYEEPEVMTRTTSSGAGTNPSPLSNYTTEDGYTSWSEEAFSLSLNITGFTEPQDQFDVLVRSDISSVVRHINSDGSIYMETVYPVVATVYYADILAAFKAATRESRQGVTAWYLDWDKPEILDKLRPISSYELPNASEAGNGNNPPWFISFDGFYLRFYVAARRLNPPLSSGQPVSPTMLNVLPSNPSGTREKVKYTVLVPGVAWNGLISISASPEGAEDNDQWADNMKYSRAKSKETWGGTIEAYQSPKEFDACDGSAEATDGVNVGQQKRESFGLCYRTEIMNDASGGESCGYLLHLLYNLTASPSERSYETINDSPDAMTLSWELDGVPVNVDGYEPLTEITIDSRYADAEKLTELEGMLFGTDESDAYQPSAQDVIDLFVTT